ncbi:MAG: carboxylesterase family protein [Sandaracinaceae bacterium]|nr:carboxylesterase family protein [Sandaracinaceae bacterium]
MRRARPLLALLLLACDGPAAVDAGASDAGDDAGPPPPPPMVTTANGPVTGTLGDGYREFLGIPFAAPPVGDLRWRPPEPPASWTEPRASNRPRRCVQDALGLPLASGEDCLYLNVHTPDPMPDHAPVMVWIHGGAFLFGEGVQTDEGTRGDLLARQGVVVVSMNYRLGPYGFLAHPDLTTEQGASGNYGLMDQRMALEWVRDNIAAFGGDPDDVTLFGQSAGGLSVCLHMTAPSSRGLFHRAIVQSGLCESGLDDLATSEANGLGFATRLGCDGPDALGCLRGKTTDEIDAVDTSGMGIVAELSGTRTWWAIRDGAFLTQDVRDAVLAGDVMDIPMVVGWNRDEGTFFTFLADTTEETLDEPTYRAIVDAIAELQGVTAADVLAAYPIADYPDPSYATAALYGHATIACPSRRAARLFAEHLASDVFVYRYDYPDGEFQIPTDRELGAFHASEIQFVFGHPAPIGRRAFTSADDLAMNARLSGDWLRFARASDPNGEAPTWAPYDVAEDRELVYDRVVTTATGLDEDACALWDAARAP